VRSKLNKWLQPTAKTVTCFAKKRAKQPPFFAAAEPGVILKGRKGSIAEDYS